jgi:hypothetical protein
MQLILEIKTGPLAGKTTTVREGHILVVGRTERANLVIPLDPSMSGAHFALEWAPKGSRVVDRNSSNGTFLNGARVTEAMVLDGDEIRAGQTTFVVHVVEQKETELPQVLSASPAAALTDDGGSANAASPGVRIGGWSLGSVPSGWELLEQTGLRRAGKDIFPSNVVVTEEQLPQDKTLQQYVDSQVFLMEKIVPEVKHGTAAPAAISGAAEAFALEIRFPADDGRPVVQRQVYARVGRSVGILTFTTLEKELPTVRRDFDSILDGVAFHSRE